MTSTIVDGLKTFIGTNCRNRIQDMENGYKTMKENKAQFSASGEILFLRYLIEYDTYLAIGGQPDNKIIPTKNHFVGEVDIKAEVMALQQKRYNILCWDWDIQPHTIWQEVGFTKGESKLIYEIAKKRRNYQEFWEEAVLPFYKQDNIIISSNGALNCCYYQMVKHYLGQFEGLPWTKWPNWVNQEAALESYRCYKADILPNISVRNEREVNLSIWDMEFNGGMAAENQRLYQVLMSAAWMIKNDPFCTFKVENGQPNPDKIAIERSNGALSLQYAILTLQNTGASFNSDNLTKLLFRSTSNFFQLRTIMAMKQCKFEQEMKISEEAQQRFLNEYNNYTYFQFGQNEGLDQAWREAYNQANIAFAKQEMDIALKTWGNGGTPEAYLEEKEAVLKNTIIQEIDNLIATMNQRIATATQSQQKIETEILQLLKEENEKKQKHIRGLETNDAMYKNVTKYFNWFYPGRTDEEFQAKLDSYKNKSLEEAEREMKDEVSRLVDAWNVNIFSLFSVIINKHNQTFKTTLLIFSMTFTK